MKQDFCSGYLFPFQRVMTFTPSKVTRWNCRIKLIYSLNWLKYQHDIQAGQLTTGLPLKPLTKSERFFISASGCLNSYLRLLFILVPLIHFRRLSTWDLAA
jgi:hypothetical protein